MNHIGEWEVTDNDNIIPFLTQIVKRVLNGHIASTIDDNGLRILCTFPNVQVGDSIADISCWVKRSDIKGRLTHYMPIKARIKRDRLVISKRDMTQEEISKRDNNLEEIKRLFEVFEF